VDPGEHVLLASAPGYESWRGTVKIDVEGQTASQEIPALNKLPEPPPGARVEPPPVQVTEPGRGQRTAALITGGAGLIAVGVGLVFGLEAMNSWQDSRPHCGDGNFCDQAGFDLVHDAKDKALVSSVLVGAGAAAIGTAVIMWFTAPKAQKGHVAFSVTPQGAGVVFSGGF
jgi:hypothetical protein